MKANSNSKLLCLVIIWISISTLIVNSYAQEWHDSLTPEQTALLAEHLKYGQPNNERLLLRNAYILDYNPKYRIPNWVAYHIDPDYLRIPDREGKFNKFSEDPEVSNPVEDKEYDGLMGQLRYARGHLAPYNIMGGDRDIDGEYANYGANVASDTDDEITVFQGNYLSNVAPQHQDTINGAGGLWYTLERWIQDKVVKKNQKDVWIYGGCVIYDTRNIELTGINSNIGVPNLFYKIVIMDSGNVNQPYILAFLFPHFKEKIDVKEKDIFKYLVTVDYVEALTGLDFFNVIPSYDQNIVEGRIEIEPWLRFISGNN